MGKLRQIAQLGHPLLREPAVAVADFHDAELTVVVADMLATLNESNGVGLAAPQIYESLCIVIVASKPNARYPHAPQMQPVIMVNPEFRPRSDAMYKDWEGCLSVPGIRALVPRYRHIEIDYYDLQGNYATCCFEDFPARIFQHEYDHLNGLVFLDRIESNRDIFSEKEYFKRLAAG